MLIRKLFQRLNEYARNDKLVKDVFDHVRNIGLVALAMGAAIWQRHRIGSGLFEIWDYTIAAILSLAAMVLGFLVFENVRHKIEHSGGPLWLRTLVTVIYIAIFAHLTMFLLFRPS